MIFHKLTFKNTLIMKVEYYNLYTHFILTTLNRFPLIEEKNRVRIEKYITGVVNNNDSKLYSIYANPEHAHLAVSEAIGGSACNHHCGQ
jgi:hypothetical protein